MRPAEFLRKKYRQGWTDAEAILLLSLADSPLATLTELTDSIGMPASTGHMALSALVTRRLLMIHDITPGKYYSLTDAGRLAILHLLS